MLKIDIADVESEPVVNLAKSLKRQFRPNSMNDISDAVVLSCYLYVLGLENESAQLLKSFLYFKYEDKPDPNRHLWVDNCQGILLLEYIEKLQEEKASTLSLSYIMGPEATISPVKFMKSQLRIFLADHPKTIRHAKSESPKYKCQTYAQQLLRCVEFIVLWGEFARSGSVRFRLKQVTLQDVRDIFDELASLLVAGLEAANKAKQAGTR